MGPQIFTDIVQGTEAWKLARAGIPTASEFSTVMAKGKGGGESVTRRKYMLKLLGERITGEVVEEYSNANMLRGQMMEEEARNAYEFLEDRDSTRVGFVRNGNIGCSPDSLIGPNGALELKTKFPHLQLECLLKNDVPSEHTDQLQGTLLVCERDWVDFASYWPKMRLFVKRVFRDERRIAELKVGLAIFNSELDKLQEQYATL